MKKKLVVLVLVGLMGISIVACGESEKVQSEKTVVETEESDAEETPEATETPEVTEEADESENSTEEEADESTVGEVVEENGIRKVPVITDKELNRTGETGPIKYSIDAIQISKLTATTDEMAEMLGIEKDKEVALAVFDVTVENTSEDTIDFYIDQGQLTTNTKEQVTCDWLLSDAIDGNFIGQVVKSGTLYFILPNSNADDITTITLHADAPFDDETFENVGDDVKIELNFE